MAITFVAPHSLHARPLVVPRGRALAVTNGTPDVSATVLADGQQLHGSRPATRSKARLAEQRSLLATLPESTFFSRYRHTFVSSRNRHTNGAVPSHLRARRGRSVLRGRHHAARAVSGTANRGFWACPSAALRAGLRAP